MEVSSFSPQNLYMYVLAFEISEPFSLFSLSVNWSGLVLQQFKNNFPLYRDQKKLCLERTGEKKKKQVSQVLLSNLSRRMTMTVEIK